MARRWLANLQVTQGEGKMADVNVADELVLKINAPRWRAVRHQSRAAPGRREATLRAPRNAPSCTARNNTIRGAERSRRRARATLC